MKRSLLVSLLFILLAGLGGAASLNTGYNPAIAYSFSDTIEHRVNITEYNTSYYDNGTIKSRNQTGWHWEPGQNTYLFDIDTVDADVTDTYSDGAPRTVNLSVSISANNITEIILDSFNPTYSDAEAAEELNKSYYWNRNEINTSVVDTMQAEATNLPVFKAGTQIQSVDLSNGDLTVSVSVTLDHGADTVPVRIGNHSANFAVSSQADWNKGAYNGTSADRADNSGILGIGYVNQTDTGTTGGHWRLDTTSGSANDYSGNGNSGSITGSPTRGVVGIWSTNAFRFNGSGDGVDLGNLGTFSENYTVSAWANIDSASVGDGNNDQVIMKAREFIIREQSGNWRFYHRDGNSNWNLVHESSGVAADTWVHLAMRWDGSTVYAYINGSQQSSQSISSIEGSADSDSIGYQASTNSLYFDGRIDEVILSDTQFSDAEITGLYRWGGDGTYNADYNSTTFNVPSGEAPTNLTVNSSNIDSIGNETWATVATSNGESQTVELGTGNTEKNYTLSFAQGGGTAWVWYNMTAGRATKTPIVRDFTLYTASTSDTTAPSITIHNPPNTTISDATPDLEVTADESVDTWIKNVDESGNTTFTPNITLSELGDGGHNVTVWANDSNGNTGSNTRYFTVEEPPNITNLAASPNPVDTGNTVNITADITDNGNLDSTKCVLKDAAGNIEVDNVSMSTTSSDTFFLEHIPTEEPSNIGQWDATCHANDTEGASSASSTTFSVDDAGLPQYQSFGFNRSSPVSPSTAVELSIDAKDAGTGLEKMILSTNETGTWQNRTDWDYTGNSYSVSDNPAAVWFDAFGNNHWWVLEDGSTQNLTEYSRDLSTELHTYSLDSEFSAVSGLYANGTRLWVFGSQTGTINSSNPRYVYRYDSNLNTDFNVSVDGIDSRGEDIEYNGTNWLYLGEADDTTSDENLVHILNSDWTDTGNDHNVSDNLNDSRGFFREDDGTFRFAHGQNVWDYYENMTYTGTKTDTSSEIGTDSLTDYLQSVHRGDGKLVIAENDPNLYEYNHYRSPQFFDYPTSFQTTRFRWKNSSVNEVVGYRFYGKDKAGNWKRSNTKTLQVTNTPNITDTTIKWEDIGGTPNKDVTATIDDQGDSDIDTYPSPPSGTEETFSNSSLVIDGWSAPFDWNVWVTDFVGVSSSDRFVNFTASDSGLQEDDYSHSLDTQQLNRSVSLHNRGDASNYSITLFDEGSVVVDGTVSGKAASGETVDTTEVWSGDWLSSITEGTYIEAQNESKTSTPTTQYIYNQTNLTVTNGKSFQFSDVDLSSQCSVTTSTTVPSGTNELTQSCNNATYNGDWLTETEYDFAPQKDEITLGINYLGDRNLELANSKSVAWSNIDTTSAVTLPNGCSQTNNSAVDLGADATTNFTIEMSCDPGDTTGDLNKNTNADSDNDTHYTYNATGNDLNITTDEIENSTVVWKIPESELNDWDSRKGNEKIYCNSRELANATFNDVPNYVRVKYWPNSSCGSSLSTSTSSIAFFYEVSSGDTIEISDDDGGSGSGSTSDDDEDDDLGAELLPSTPYRVTPGMNVTETLTVRNYKNVENRVELTIDPRPADACQYVSIREVTKGRVDDAGRIAVNTSGGFGDSGLVRIPPASEGSLTGSSSEIPVQLQIRMPDQTTFERVKNENGSLSCRLSATVDRGTVNDVVLEVEPKINPFAWLFDLIGQFTDAVVQAFSTVEQTCFGENNTALLTNETTECPETAQETRRMPNRAGAVLIITIFTIGIAGLLYRYR